MKRVLTHVPIQFLPKTTLKDLKRVFTILAAVLLLSITATAAFAYTPYGYDEYVEWYEHQYDGKPIIIQQIEPSFGGCFISTGHGLLDDLDCDKVPDAIDNCPHAANPDQFDQTGNGLGDACDLVINIVEPEPPVILQGRSFITNIDVTNYREYEMRNLRVVVEVPTLGIGETYYVGSVLPGQSMYEEAILRIPVCAYPGEHKVKATVEFPYAAGHKEVFTVETPIAVDVSGACPMEPTNEQKTVVEILEIQDVHEDGADYPFTITNNEGYDKAYVLSIEGTDDWGYTQIEPGTLILVPAGETREGAVKVWAYDDAEGEHGFVLTIQARDDIKQVHLKADIIDDIDRSIHWQLNWIFGLIIFVAVVALVAVLIWRKAK